MPVLIATLADNRSFIMPMKNKKWNAQVFGRGIRWVSQLGRLAKMVLMGGSVAAAAQTLPAPAPVAVVANTNLISSASSWPQLPEARGVYDFNQGWLFWLPPPPKPLPPYAPRSADCIKQGEFPNSTSAQDVMVGAHQSRYVCLESLSSQRDTPFASVAEFWLLDEKGAPLPRVGWKVAYVDSEDANANDVAANAIDGNASTKWHSQWQSAQPPQPHQLVIDLGKPTPFAGFRYLPRADGNTVSMIKGWRFYATDQRPPSRENPAASPVRSACERAFASGGLRAGRIHRRFVRRQFQLARARYGSR